MVEGIVPGTFALELIHLANTERGSGDIVVTFPWSSGARGPARRTWQSITPKTRAGKPGPLSGPQGNHGSMSPVDRAQHLHRPGASISSHGATVRTPVSNVDLTPTLLALMGL